MKVFVTGATGYIGTALQRNLTASGHTILGLARSDEAAAKLLDRDARTLLANILPVLMSVDEWSAATTEPAVKSFAEAQGTKLGKIAQPLRAALTGRKTSPGIFEVLAILGREESLARIGDQSTP